MNKSSSDDFDAVCKAESGDVAFDPPVVAASDSPSITLPDGSVQHSCAGQCHSQHQSGQCWCDEGCVHHGDCCSDVTESCFASPDVWTVEETHDFVESADSYDSSNFEPEATSFVAAGSYEAAGSFETVVSGSGSGSGSGDAWEAAGSYLLLDAKMESSVQEVAKKSRTSALVPAIGAAMAVVGALALIVYKRSTAAASTPLRPNAQQTHV